MDALDLILDAQTLGLLPVFERPVVLKGYCPHCGKKIARGVWMHTQHCRAKP